MLAVTSTPPLLNTPDVKMSTDALAKSPVTLATIGAMLVERSYFDVPTVAAWGANAKPERVAQVLAMPGAHRLMCLGLTKAGQPRHPLYLRSDAALIPFGGSS